MPVLSDAPFYAPLKTSLILQNGSGTATFTRATNRTVFDNEGKLITLPSGAAAFGGARCVRNRFSGNTDNLSGLTAGRITLTNSSAVDADGGTKAGLYTLDATSGEHYLRTQTTALNGRDVNLAFKIKLSSYRWICLRIESSYNFYDLQTQSWVGTLQGLSRDATVSDGWVLLQMTATTSNTGSSLAYALVPTSSSLSVSWTPTGTEQITVYHAMLSDVTGQADKSTSEYVSNGVLSAPYHGAGVDGIRYFDTNKDGSPIPESTLKRLKLNSAAVTNTALWCRDFTNAAWVKDGVTPLLNQVGIDGQVNSCSLLTATKDNAKVYQTITAASSSGCAGVSVKRSIGTGRVWFTRDNYTTLLDITDLINSGTFTLCAIENTSVLNPVVGFELETSGDAIIADAVINHLGTEIAGTIFTTSTAVTVNAETLTYQTSGNFSDTAGTIIATVERGNWANNNGVVVGKAGSGLSTSASNSGVQALDGTNTVNGPAGSAATRRKIGMKWSGSTMKTFAGGNFGTAGSYGGSFNLTTIAIMPQSNGYIRDVAVWPTELSDADMLSVASEQSDFSAAVTLAAAAYANVIHSVSAAMPFSFSATAYASVIHSVSAAIGIDFNTAMRANVIHSVSAELGITFSTDFDLTWIIPSLTMAGSYSPLTVVGSYSPPVIQGTYGPTT